MIPRFQNSSAATLEAELFPFPFPPDRGGAAGVVRT